MPHKEKLFFANARGEKLSAILEVPDGRSKACVLYAHCFTCDKNIPIAARISRALVLQGFTVLRFDFTGLGQSEGEFSATNFSTNVADVIAASDFLKNQYTPPEIMIGHSLGGTAALVAASKLSEVKAVATIGSPAEPVHVLHHFIEHLDTIQEQGSAEVQIGGRPFTISQQMVEDFQHSQVEEVIENLRKPLMIFHSPFDRVVNVRQSAIIYKAAHHPKSFISLDGADHMLSRKHDSDFVADVLAAWVCRYIHQVALSNLNPSA